MAVENTKIERNNAFEAGKFSHLIDLRCFKESDVLKA